MASALKGVPEVDREPPPGVVTINGEYYFDEYQPGQGVASLGLDDATPDTEQKKSDSVQQIF
ncbi:MAG TPA: hypothetical protein VF229_06070, partial [Burkholderiaceae bacterium]